MEPTSDPVKLREFIQKYEKLKPLALEQSVKGLAELLAKQNVNNEQISEFIQKDALCLWQFILYANKYKQSVAPDSEKEILSAKHGSMLIGLEQVKSFQKTLKPLAEFKSPEVTAKISQLSYRGVHAAQQAAKLAKLLKVRNIEEIVISATLTPLIEMLIWLIDEQKAQKYELLCFKQRKPMQNAQIEVFGFYFRDLLNSLAEIMTLPPLFMQSQSIETLDEQKKSIRCVVLADKLVRLIDFGWFYPQMEEFFDYAKMHTAFSADRLACEFHQVSISLARNLDNTFKYHYPVNYLLFHPGKLEYQQVIELLSEKKPTPAPKKIAPKPQRPKSKANINLESAMNIPTLIHLSINALCVLENIHHVCLMLLNKKHDQLAVRINKGKNSKLVDDFSLSIDFTQKSFLTTLFKNKASVMVDEIFREKYGDLFAPGELDTMQMNTYSAYAFSHHKKPIGIFFVEHSTSNRDLHQQFTALMKRFEKHAQTM